MTTFIEGNSIDNIPVISVLNVDELPAGQHQFYFRTITNALSQWQHIPVWVFKGEQAGKKMLLTAGVHGDEYNGVLTAHAVVRQLQAEKIKGSIVVIPTLNLNAMLNRSRHFFSPDPEVISSNLNRIFPGNSEGNEAQRYLAAIWQNLLQGNADLAIDLHTQTSGYAFPLYIYADFRVPEALQMARLINPDVIFDDPGEAGVLETVWNQHQVPCITLEVGQGRYTDAAMVERTQQGVFNILKYHQFIEGKVTEIIPAFESPNATNIRAKQGGFVLMQVQLMQSVEKDQLLATQYNDFGQLTHEYLAPKAGVVVSVSMETMRACGSSITRIMHS